MSASTSISSASDVFQDFHLESFGHLVVPDHPIRFGFQVDIVPENCPRQIFFGLVANENINSGHPKSYGFAVRIDLENGEIWDVLNGAGLVGWVEHQEGLSGFTDEEPLLLGWEIELHGHALVPKLQVADQQWLYPTIHCPDATTMEAIVGWQDEWDIQASQIFLHPALWREQVSPESPSATEPKVDGLVIPTA